MVFGILLLLGGAVFGANIFIQRHRDKELVSSSENNVESSSTDEGAVTVPSFDKTTFSNSDPASIWVVVNKLRPLGHKEYAPSDLVSVGNG